MSISVPKTIKLTLFGLTPFSILVFFVVTGFHYVPVNLTIGSCIMDYTSPSTYSERSSPLKSYEFDADGDEVLVCYGSPSARGRKVFGELVPFDKIWRLGANEPTRLYTSTDLVVGEVVVPKGRYSLYAVPGKNMWEIFVSTSTYHWGNDISESVREQEIGSFEVKPEYNSIFVENFSVRSQDDKLIIEWENTRLIIPITNFGED
tara:strand:- start:75664 stop:76278 length:615 start_codon:yes stop_codon:yes gene_type:complete